MSAGSRPGPLVHRLEGLLIDGSIQAMALMAAGRLAMGYLVDGKLWFLQSQVAGLLLLASLINLLAAFLPRTFSFLAGLAGIIGWLAAASLIPRFGWPREPLPKWQLYGAVVCWVVVQIVVAVLSQRWKKELRGHGFAWIEQWAAEKSYYARRLAQRYISVLAHRG